MLWVAFGLIALTLYFANSMSFELRASDNRAAMIEADQAIIGAARYVSNVIATVREPATLPDINNYRSEQVPVGDATFWLIGRADRQTAMDQVYYGLVDESSKLDLNAPWLTVDLLMNLPGMTTEFAAAILDWRDTDSDVNEAGGAEDETYQRRSPAYRCKNGPFESVEELRLVNGALLDSVYGEDANLNGVLDPNENDADGSVPMDNRDGRLDYGMFEYFTVYSRQATLDPYGSNRLAVSTLNTAAGRSNLLMTLNTVGVGNAQEIVGRVQGANISSILHFYIASQMAEEDFLKLEPSLTMTNQGCVNVNSASEAVLSCVPGIGLDNAPTLVAARRSNANRLNTIAWVKDALDQQVAIQAGRYLIGRTYNISADIAAVGHNGRGYRRVKYVFDTTEGPPMIRFRQDLTHLGWSLGKYTKQQLSLANQTRR
ncbi:MAG: general secretion pathway protein GspK [Verrucomicrobia bacterium]|nr:general secretion pathway protein GspK [Verrucomicrobiota bacterium]